MPPFEGPKPKKSIGERAAAQNKRAAEQSSKKILEGLIAGINKRYKNDPEMRKQKLKELRADRKEQREKRLKKQQKEFEAIMQGINPVDPPITDPQNMAPRIEKGVLTRGAARGGPVGYSQRWKTGRKG